MNCKDRYWILRRRHVRFVVVFVCLCLEGYNEMHVEE